MSSDCGLARAIAGLKHTLCKALTRGDSGPDLAAAWAVASAALPATSSGEQWLYMPPTQPLKQASDESRMTELHMPRSSLHD